MKTLQEFLNEKLAEWKTPANQQFFGSRTETFGDSFPEKAMVKNETDLQDKLWWWRRVNKSNWQTIFALNGGGWYGNHLLEIFPDHLERSAFFYELRARYGGRYRWDFGSPWVRCSFQQWQVLKGLLQNQHPAKFSLPHNERDLPWVAIQGEKFNLELSDETLVGQFLEYLAKIRTETKISSPAKGKGTRRRQMSWRPIESMDIRRYDLRVLTEGERSALSKAERVYEKDCAKLGIAP